VLDAITTRNHTSTLVLPGKCSHHYCNIRVRERRLPCASRRDRHDCIFIFAATFMAAQCLNVKSPHSIPQWQHHYDLQPQAIYVTTTASLEHEPILTFPQQSRTQPLWHFRRHRVNHYNHSTTTHDSQTLMERDYFNTWQPFNGLSKSQDWSTSQLWARAGQRWSDKLFYTIFGRWFLYRNPK